MGKNCINDEKMEKVIGGFQVNVNKKRCIACEMCVITCPSKAISIINNCASINYDLCTLCGKCISACPTGAISKKEAAQTR